jgi:hypothetical protein
MGTPSPLGQSLKDQSLKDEGWGHVPLLSKRCMSPSPALGIRSLPQRTTTTAETGAEGCRRRKHKAVI